MKMPLNIYREGSKKTSLLPGGSSDLTLRFYLRQHHLISPWQPGDPKHVEACNVILINWVILRLTPFPRIPGNRQAAWDRKCT